MKIQLELTNYCNLSCVECSYHLMRRPKQHMSEEVFNRVLNIIEERKPTSVILNKDGEPLLHPKIKSLISNIAHVTDRTCNIDIHTNGLLLTSSFINFLALLKNNVRFFITFHYNNHDGSNNDYSKIINLLLEVLKRNYPRIHFTFIIIAENLEKIKEYNEFKYFWDGGSKCHAVVLFKNDLIRNIHRRDLSLNTRNSCPYINDNYLFIGNTGNVISCCADMEEENLITNIMNEDISLILQQTKKFYRNLKNKTYNDFCNYCLSQEV